MASTSVGRNFFSLRTIECNVRHFCMSRMLAWVIDRDPRLGELNEIMRGASFAYKHFHKELSVSSDVSHLRDLVADDIYDVIRLEREEDQSGFQKIRDSFEKEDLEKMEWPFHQAFLTEVGVEIDTEAAEEEDDVENGEEEEEENRDMTKREYQEKVARRIKSYRLGFTFLSECQSPWIEGKDVRDDTIEFTATSTGTGKALGDWVITGIS